MSFNEREESRALGQPDTLYLFNFNDRFFAYTDAEQPITTADGVRFEPIPIDRSAISSSGTLDKSTLTIRMPVAADICDLFRVFPPSDVVGVTIFQGHADETEFLAIFFGRVLSGARKGIICTLNCEPASTSMRRPGLRRRWQYPCPHVLYGPSCRARREDFTFQRQVAAIGRGSVTMGAGWQGSFAREKYENGLFQWEGSNGVELRNILRVTDDVLLLDGRIRDLAAGQTVSLSLGCAHNMDDCLNTFNNIHNYGGDAWIPTVNPIGSVNRFY